MAILSEDSNEYEVKIKRIPQNAYFEEHVKVGDPEAPGALKSKRYIVAEPGQRYGVEVTLKKGFEFGEYKQAEIRVLFSEMNVTFAAKVLSKTEIQGKLNEGDFSTTLAYINVSNQGDLIGAPFTFQKLGIDETLVNEADVLGIDPRDLASFTVIVFRRLVMPDLVDYSEQANSFGNDFWRAQKVDQESFKKHGITHATSLDGPRTETRPLGCSKFKFKNSEKLWFQFHYRTAESLQQLNIVPYPPPLRYYPWEKLNESQRRDALCELQDISKSDYRERTRESAESGEIRKEWRAWFQMNPVFRKVAFERLQREHKKYVRGEVQQQLATLPAHRFIVIDEDGPSAGRVVAYSETPQKPSGLSGTRKRKRSIKQEPIDLDTIDEGAIAIPSIELHPAARGIKEEPIDADIRPNVKKEWPPATIKHDLVDEDTRVVKKVKFEEEPPVDLAQFDEFRLAIAAEVEPMMENTGGATDTMVHLTESSEYHPDTTADLDSKMEMENESEGQMVAEIEVISEEERLELEQWQARMDQEAEEGIARAEREMAELMKQVSEFK